MLDLLRVASRSLLAGVVPVLLCLSQAGAQDVTPAPVAASLETPSATHEPTPAPVAAAQASQPAAPALVLAQPVLGATPRSVGLELMPGWSTIQQLRELQQKESEIWSQREGGSLAGHGVGIALGLASAIVLIPIGSVLIADSRYTYSDYYGDGEIVDRQERRVGRSLVTLGVLSVALTAFCSWSVRRIKERRSVQERELYRIGANRTVLENVLGDMLLHAYRSQP